MLWAGLLAGTLAIGMILGDWFQFARLSAQAGYYGCVIARLRDPLPFPSLAALARQFDAQGLLVLPSGVARLFPNERMILLRPYGGPLSRRLRTAWPLKVTIVVEADAEATRFTCVKRVPWSSAILTGLWFGLVGLGTVLFAVLYVAQGGLASMGGALMGLGIVGLGAVVLLFGLITVILAYRLEDQRLTQAYQDLRTALTPS
jgi:hypothetical protein